MAKVIFIIYLLVVFLQPSFGQNRAKLLRCPKPPKISKIAWQLPSFFKERQDKPQILSTKKEIEDFKNLGEQIAINDTTPKQKKFVNIGQGNRMIDLQDSVLVNNRKVTLTIYDYALVDGDNITLFQNGEKLIQTFVKSQKKPTVLKIRIRRKSPSIIEMMANNLGYIPPNTAMIEVNDGNITKKIVLYSNIKESGAFKITHTKTKIKKKPERVIYPKFS